MYKVTIKEFHSLHKLHFRLPIVVDTIQKKPGLMLHVYTLVKFLSWISRFDSTVPLFPNHCLTQWVMRGWYNFKMHGLKKITFIFTFLAFYVFPRVKMDSLSSTLTLSINDLLPGYNSTNTMTRNKGSSEETLFLQSLDSNLWKYGTLALYCIGCVGNLLTIIVLTR